MGLNLVYDKDGVYQLDGKPITEGLYQIRWGGNLVDAYIHTCTEKRFRRKNHRAWIELVDGSKRDLVKHRIPVEVPGALHRIPGEGAWHGSGGMTCC